MIQVTQAQVRNELEREASAHFGISADEFITRFRAGDLDLRSPVVQRLGFMARVLETDYPERPRVTITGMHLRSRARARLAGLHAAN